MPVKSRHLLLLFYKISISLYALLSAVQNLTDASAVEVPFQLLAISFAKFPGLSRQSLSGDLSGDLSQALTSGSLRGPNPDYRVDDRAVPSGLRFLCTRKQTGKPTGTNFPISQNLHHSLDCMMPHSKLRCNFSDCYPSVLSDELVDFLLVALSCSSSRPTTERLIGDVRVSILKIFHPPSDTAGTHADISIHTTKSLVDVCCRVSLFLQEIQWQHVDETICRWQPFSCSAWPESKRCACADFSFMLESEDAANGPVTLITIYPPESS
jgi:hypothetical protein